MSEVIASGVLANGLRTEFANTYTQVRNRVQDSKLPMLMDLGIKATNREHKFGYFEAAPHFEQWIRGQSIPTDSFDSTDFDVSVYTWGRRVKWHHEDREDDQTSSLMQQAQGAGQSAALLPERFAFDILTNNAATLPAIPLAPDGAALFATTDGGGGNRFGASSGNLLTGGGVASAAAVKSDFYAAMEQFYAFQDGKGQPLWNSSIIDQGFVVLFGSANIEVMQEAFVQRRQGFTFNNTGSTTATSGIVGGNTPSNVILDSQHDVTLWPTSRITGNDIFILLKGSPMPPLFLLDRKGVTQESALRGENNSDYVRDTGMEYQQWHSRSGAGVALPFGAIQINN